MRPGKRSVTTFSTQNGNFGVNRETPSQVPATPPPARWLFAPSWESQAAAVVLMEAHLDHRRHVPVVLLGPTVVWQMQCSRACRKLATNHHIAKLTFLERAVA